MFCVVVGYSYADHAQVQISLLPASQEECMNMTCISLPVATVDTDGEVVWSNNGVVPISITGDINSGTVEPGQTYSFIFDEAGQYAYNLESYPWITGTIVVEGDEHMHDDMVEDGHMHAHGSLESDTMTGVNIDIIMSDGGVIVHTITEGWTWTPENVNMEHIDGEGHAHLYVGGEKHRVYNPYYYIGGLEFGVHHIRVTLNANTHEEIINNGSPTEAIATVVVPEHTHTHYDSAPVTGTDAMEVSAVVHPDAMSGYNLQVISTDFDISGDGINQDHILGQGYARVSIDGEYTNLYGEWLKIPVLESGPHTITVSLWSNDHAPYHWNSEPIETTIAINEDG